MSISPLVLAVVILAMPCAAQESGSKNLDKTGIRWQLPFEQALEKAKKEKRLLLIKPVAFGTSRDGGW